MAVNLQCTALHRTLSEVHKKIHWSYLTFHNDISVTCTAAKLLEWCKLYYNVTTSLF